MFKESIIMSIQNIIHNKLRSFLTILGIVIGVTAIIALITIVEGVTGEIKGQFAALGAGKLTITAKGTTLKQGLTNTDIEKLLEIDNVEGISPTISFTGNVVKGTELDDEVSIEGKNEFYFEENGDLIGYGRPLNILDMQNKNNVCEINDVISKNMFTGEDPLGKTVRINGLTFTVVGVIDSSVNTDIMSRMSTDSTKGRVIIPYTTAMSMSGEGNITSLEIIVADTSKMNDVIDSVKVVLNEAFNYKDNSYKITNLDSLLDTMDTMMGLMTSLLAGIASIALLVGGIGIMNMMLVSVTERTTEIGLRKALGAEPKSIQLQFLIESIVLSLLGGIVGLILGLTISWIAAVAIGVAFKMSVNAIILGVGFSALVGIIFGWAPARRASRLNPIDALRSI